MMHVRRERGRQKQKVLNDGSRDRLGVSTDNGDSRSGKTYAGFLSQGSAKFKLRAFLR